ncbi:UNVERIFIED_CONTAM: hypothetical protein Sradi_2045900 [Sesamum radiatum]|uniref:Uncharacterized protein n=1 Tax=Sesamum radiatum TaxID=300843 RepID=A0AAW2TK45_SESRA
MFPLTSKRLWRHPATPRLYKLLKEPPCSSLVRRPPLVGDHPRPVDPLTESPHYNTSSEGAPPKTPIHHTTYGHHGHTGESNDLFLAYTITPSNVDVPNKEDKRIPPAPVPLVAGVQGPPSQTQKDISLQWLARLECLQKGLQDVQYQIAGTCTFGRTASCTLQ